ncbi:iron uptake transporter deferrochelatase/peroxidase subunit [Streptomyces sp. ST2-7A]|uniref:iron uptake transporter deferrochelatase/peroxidase subunit n=1 Tax=Streptomyces sp. ST2-7A TaxID=2907214 RepID=UPI001F43BA16|nr:iron uptake transporter deferrochelatase/peroxidase subunit [Streptomyces sp. ST2-7A]MCE7081437.1 iron uptake transporter deferrochelatase/peroxidase subunit [Streptomyces sp. ST2-7A]
MAGTGPEPAAPGAGVRAGVSRRRLLGTAGAAGATGLAVGAGGGRLLTGPDGAADPNAPGGTAPLSSVGATRLDFHGTHQPGITGPARAHGELLAFDLLPGAGRGEAAALLRRWSRAAEAMMAGEAPDADNGVAGGTGPSGLAVTLGFGHDFFDAVGLVDARPRALDPLPEFSADALDPERSGGQLWIQVEADDPTIVFHAVRTLQRAAGGTARVRHRMAGFNRAPGAASGESGPRNLMGQIDGTNNPRPEQEDFAGRVFVPADGEPAWMAGGSYVVVRRIRMLLDSWEEEPTETQERILGRRKTDGAPLTGGGETSPVDLAAVDERGRPVIPADAHVRVSAPESNGGAAMLRRSYSYHDGFTEDGSPDAGLLFVCWQADPVLGFVPVQRKLDRGDALSAFIRHEASGLFAVPGGAEPGGYVGQRLLEG